MKTPKLKAEELVEKYQKVRIFDDIISGGFPLDNKEAIECAKIAVENEYYSLREQVIRLKHSLDESLYLKLIPNLLNEEQEVKNELNKMS